MLVYTCEQMRVIEENADVNGLSYLEMMERAGKGCAKKINSVLSGNINFQKSAVILCGTGKNGGDGYVIAGSLCDMGYNVRIILVDGYPEAYESKMMYSYLEDKPVVASDLEKNYAACVAACQSASAIVDCIFGIGFHGELDERIAGFFKDISDSRAKRFAVDIPSGLEGNSGEIKSACFDADHTLAITCYKPVHILKPAADKCGIVSLIDIGIDASCYEAVSSNVVYTADTQEIARFFKPRRPDSNKGDYGRLLCVAGSRNMQGAAVMAAQAAVNSGAGVVTCVFPESAYPAIAAKLTEPLTVPMRETAAGTLSNENAAEILSMAERSDAILLGCGLGLDADTCSLVYGLLTGTDRPVILDADGINAVALNMNVLKEASAPVIITPHPGEMARLTGLSVDEIQRDRVGTAGNFAAEYGCITVLKGSNTVVAAPSGNVYVNRTGNAGMSTGGSGDVLAGIIASFVCQRMGLQSAAVSGVYVHGMCGDVVCRKLSMRGVTPTRMIGELAEVLSNFE